MASWRLRNVGFYRLFLRVYVKVQLQIENYESIAPVESETMLLIILMFQIVLK